MGTVITVMNMKGGVGKTTVSAHIGGMLARYQHGGKRRSVLLIDYDPQFNLSQSFIPAKDWEVAEKARKTVLAVLLDDPTKLDPFRLYVSANEQPPALSALEHCIYKKSLSSERLSIIPSTIELMYVALGEATGSTRPIEHRFKGFIAEAREQFDVVIIDCHPAGSIFTKTALQNSDHVIIPVVPEGYSVRGIGLMMTFMAAQKIGVTGPTAHILFNRVPINGISIQENQIRANPHYAPYCLTRTLKKYSVFADPKEGKGFAWSSGKPWSTTAFGNLSHVTAEVVARLKL